MYVIHCPIHGWNQVEDIQNRKFHHELCKKFCISCLIYKKWSVFSHATLILGKKSFCKTYFKLGKELKKVQKQGRDERTQEDYPTSAKIHTRCRVVFLRSFISALFLYFFQLYFKLGKELKKVQNKAEMKERKKTTLHLQKYTPDVG